MANNQGLQYLSDCSLASMYLGNMKQSVAEKLQGINDIVRTEQYMDFITNRRFRSTLLCHAEVKLNRALDNDSAKKFAISLDITAEKLLKDVVIESNDPMKFYFKGDKDQYITTNSPALKAAFYVPNLHSPIFARKIHNFFFTTKLLNCYYSYFYHI